MAYITFQPSDYFNTVTYTGNGSAGNGITGVGFQPDWVWIKRRESGAHNLVDVVRGVNNAIASDSDGGQGAYSNNLSAFGTDGFTLGDGSLVNANAGTYVAWNWKTQNAQGSSNTDGTINTTYTSVNTTAGISISQYTGNGSNSTFGHGLGAVPKLVMVKDIGTSVDWLVYHSALGNTKNLRLNTNEQVDTSSTIWNNTTPTSSVVSVGTASAVNGNGNNYIAYCFAEKKGFSKFGSYKGNNNSDGVFIYTGFKPAFIMCRFTGTGNGYDWIMYDNKRPKSTNPTPNILEANTTDAENTNSNFNCDILSNGFKFRGTESNVNGASNYLYWAFAEEPLVSSNNIPATAR
jgi:hypothetical protein